MSLAEATAAQLICWESGEAADASDSNSVPPAPATTAVLYRTRKPSELKPRGTVPARDGYPRFSRRGDRLIKTGFSKTQREEYEHHASKAAVLAVAEALRQHTKPERIVAVADFPVVPDPAKAGDLPGYQVYLVLAWLRVLGVARKHGRSGYGFERKELEAEVLEKHWKKLPPANEPPETPKR